MSQSRLVIPLTHDQHFNVHLMDGKLTISSLRLLDEKNLGTHLSPWKIDQISYIGV